MNAGWEALLTGKTLADRYLIGEPIGRGGMSVVYRGEDRTLGRPVAVKVIAMQPRTEEVRARLRARFRREAGAAAGIPPHPNMVHIYDYGTDPALDLDFIVMELLRGRDLKWALAAPGLDLPQSLRVLREAARGLAAGHRAGLVHRDVKPANIFLVGEEQLESVRVLDFGIAKALDVDDELTLAHETAPHSPAYASPEQRVPGAAVTPASDVFQLGLVAYEMLADARPFTDEERQRLGGGEAVPVPEHGRWASVPAGIRAVVERALEANPGARFADAAEFAEALARAETDGPGATTRAGGFAAPPPPATPPRPSGDETLLDAPPPYARAEPRLEGVPVAAPPARGRRPSGWSPRNTGIALAAAAALLVGGVWAVTRGGGEGVGGAAELDLASLDETFRELQVTAAAALMEEGPPGEDAQAAAQVQQVIVDLYRAWADGDLDRHASHYADRVSFYGRRVRRSAVLRERTRERERLDEVDVTIERQAVEFPEPGEARALVDRSWRLRGPDLQWEGAARQELRLEWRDDRWRIVSEDDVEVYRSECTGC